MKGENSDPGKCSFAPDAAQKKKMINPFLHVSEAMRRNSTDSIIAVL